MHQPHIFSPCTSPKCPTAPGALTPKPEAITRALISSFSRARVRAPGKAARLAGTGQVGFPTGTLWSRTSQLPPGRTWRPPGKGSGKCLLGVKTKRKGARRGRRALSVTLVRKFQCNQVLSNLFIELEEAMDKGKGRKGLEFHEMEYDGIDMTINSGYLFIDPNRIQT